MASRVARPDTLTIQLTEGDWILVKKRLTAGENREMLRRGRDPETGRVDGMNFGYSKILAYLVDWSFKGLDEKVIPIRDQSAATVGAALDAIDPDSYVEVLKAIDAHEEAMAAERAREKKTSAGALSSAPTSASAA